MRVTIYNHITRDAAPVLAAGYVLNPIKEGTHVMYKGKRGIVSGPLAYKITEPWLFVTMEETHKQVFPDPKEVKVIG